MDGLPVLSDGVVVLREFGADDAPALAEIWADAAIRARNEAPAPSVAAALRWVDEVAARNASGERWEWAVADAESGALAGRLALKELDWRHRRAELALWIGPEFRGRRYAGRALRLAAAYAFEQRGLARIHAEVELDNEASLRALLAAGMRHEGTLRAWYVTDAGAALDLHVLGLVAEDLRSSP